MRSRVVFRLSLSALGIGSSYGSQEQNGEIIVQQSPFDDERIQTDTSNYDVLMYWENSVYALGLRAKNGLNGKLLLVPFSSTARAAQASEKSFGLMFLE